MLEHLKLTLQGEAMMKIGCEDHNRGLTSSILMVYLTLRMHFICAKTNKMFQLQKQKKRNWAKLAKQAS